MSNAAAAPASDAALIPRPGWVLAVIVFLALLGAVLRGATAPMILSAEPLLLDDPDTALHLRLVRDAISAQSLHVPVIPDDNAPRGRINEWSIANTLALRIAFALGGADAERRVLAFFAPTIGLLMVLGVGLLAWSLREPTLALLWSTGAALLPGCVQIGESGATDHHTLQVLGLLWLLAAVVLFFRTGRGWIGAVAGAMSAMLFSLGAFEHFPAFGLLCILALVDTIRSPEDAAHRRFWNCWMGAGFVATVLFLLPLNAIPPTVDALHPWHLLLWISAGAVLLLTRRGSTLRWRCAIGLGAGLVMIAVCAALAVVMTSGEVPAVFLDPRFDGHLRVIAEFKAPGGGGARALLVLAALSGLLPLVPLALLRLGGELFVPRHAALCLSLFVFAGVLFQLNMLRGVRFSAPVLAVLAPALLWCLAASTRAKCLLLAVAMAFPLFSTAQRVNHRLKHVTEGQLLERQTHRAAKALRADLMDEHVDGVPPVVLLPFHYAPYFLKERSARPMGSQYWSNLDGLHDGTVLFTTARLEEFRDLSIARQARFILLPPEPWRRRAVATAWDYRHGDVPDLGQVHSTILYQLERNGNYVVSAPQLEATCPGWVLLRNPYADSASEN